MKYLSLYYSSVLKSITDVTSYNTHLTAFDIMHICMTQKHVEFRRNIKIVQAGRSIVNKKLLFCYCIFAFSVL